MLPPVDPLIVVVALASLVLVMLAVVARRRQRRVAVLQRELGERIEADAAARGRAARLDDLEAREEHLQRELAVVADLSGMAFIRLDDDARVAFANGLAHQYLERELGTLVGQTAATLSSIAWS